MEIDRGGRRRAAGACPPRPDLEARGDDGDLHLPFHLGSTTAPKMMLASSCAASWMIADVAHLISEGSLPPVT